jgi:hypothetical protein
MDNKTQSFSLIIKLGLHRTTNAYEIVGKSLCYKKNNLRMNVDITFNFQGIATKIIAIFHCSSNYTTNIKQIKFFEYTLL